MIQEMPPPRCKEDGPAGDELQSRQFSAGEVLAVIIPSANRPTVLHETLLSVLRQRRLPTQIIVCVPSAEHVSTDTRRLAGVTIIYSDPGLTRQRNRAIAELVPSIDLVTFLDDDVELHEDYLKGVAQLFQERRDAVLAGGRVLADGRAIGGIQRALAETIVAADVPQVRATAAVTDIGPGEIYGCNMSVRREVLATVRFDERLPLYGLMEDRDFAHQCSRHGRLVRSESCRVVHLGVSSGRISERQYGFAQLMNPIYLWRKGSITSAPFLIYRISRTLAVNALLAVVANQPNSRRSRLAGNLRAAVSALSGRVAPEDILEL